MLQYYDDDESLFAVVVRTQIVAVTSFTAAPDIADHPAQDRRTRILIYPGVLCSAENPQAIVLSAQTSASHASCIKFHCTT